MITRKIYVTQRRRVEPLSVVYGNDAVGIALRVEDFAIPAGASAVAHARSINDSATYQCSCAIEDNVVTFTPPIGFFRPGNNVAQVDITTAVGHVITFTIDVNCTPDIVEGTNPATPESVMPIIERVKTELAQSVESAAQDIEAVKQEAVRDITGVSWLEFRIDDIGNLFATITEESRIDFELNERGELIIYGN